MQELTFLYGYPAAGKTTFAKHFLDGHPDHVLVVADLVRKHLYGSQDHYGNSQEIYEELLSQMAAALKSGKSVLYDGTNLKRQDRIDFLTALLPLLGSVHQEIIQLPTNMEVCIGRHLQRDRNIPLTNLLPYFRIKEPPVAEEGWDEILTCCTCAYIASPFFEAQHRANAIKAAEILRAKALIHICHWNTRFQTPGTYQTTSGVPLCTGQTSGLFRMPTPSSC